MNTAPVEPSRRSRREARDVPPAGSAADPSARPDTAPSDTPARRAALLRLSPAEWMPLAAAAGALLVAVVIGLLVTVAFSGAAGHSLAAVVASLVLGATGVALTVRLRPEGFLRLRALDVLWAFALGVVLPFVAGVFAGAQGWPAFAALSPRWLALGVVAPFVTLLALTLFSVGLVFPAVLAVTSARLSPVIARVVAGVVAALGFIVVPIVFRGDVSGMPVALPIVLGIAVAVFVALARRVWGPLLLSVVFTGLWVGLSIVGTLLA